MKFATSASGRQIPMLGLGTWQVTGDTVAEAVRMALSMGYRHIDTAEAYRNQRDIARGIAASGVARDDLFITTKVFREHLRHDEVLAACESTLRDLNLSYIDLYLIHWPNPSVPMTETFQALNQLQERGLVRDIGVSNFNSRQLDEALSVSANPITANQIEYHPYLNQEKLLAHCKSRGVHVTAYSPLGQGRPLKDPVLVDIAGRIGRSPAQVALKWLLNKDIIVIPRARSAEHLQSNLDVFDWELVAEDQAKIDAIKTVERYVSPPWAKWDEV